MARTSIVGESKGVAVGSTAIDTNEYGTVTIIAVSAAAVGAELTLTECDTSNGTFTAVDSSDVVGAELTAGKVTFDVGTVNLVGYIGNKRYIKAAIAGTGTTGAVLLSEKRYAE